MAIEQKQLGKLSAEKDSNLSKYFYADTAFYKASLDMYDSRFILLGRTGSGKSAILSYIKNYFDDDDDVFVSMVCDDSNNLKELSRASDREGEEQEAERILYKTAWYYTIIIQILREVFPDGPISSIFSLGSERENLVYDFLREVGDLRGATKLVDLFKGFVKSLDVKLKMSSFEFSLGGSVVQEQSKLYNVVRDFLQDDLLRVIGGKRLYVLIDDIDIDWDPRDGGQQRILGALYYCLGELSRFENVKCVLALRTNIFLEATEVGQREKIRDEIIPIQWTRDMLKGFLKIRVSKVYDLNEGEVERFFDDGVLDLMIDYTLLRPRDLLSLCQLAISSASAKKQRQVVIEDVMGSLDEYSLERILALEDEWPVRYQKLSKFIDVMAKALLEKDLSGGLATRVFHEVLNGVFHIVNNDEELSSQLHWFLELYPKPNSDPESVLSVLYSMGFVSIHLPNGTYLIHDDPSRETKAPVSSGAKIMIHPMFGHYMQPATMMQGEEQSLWLTDD